MAAPIRLRPWYCGLPCSELRIEAGPDGSWRADGGCPACRDEVLALREDGSGPRVRGREASVEQALAAAAAVLAEARSPFVYGLSRSATSTARRACALAASLGGSLDVEAPPGAAADREALQAYGIPGATFGEIRNHADLLVLWRCDPQATHPHLFDRHPQRAIVVPPDPAGSKTSASPPAGPRPDDLVLPVRAGDDLATILSLRALLAGWETAGKASGGDGPAGVSPSPLREAATRIKEARYTALIWGPEATDGPDGAALASAFVHLVRDLNRTARGAARPLGAGGNVAGAAAALLGATGFPGAVGFASGVARHAPGEHGAARMIGEGRADAVLLIGARALPAAGAGRGPRPKLIVVGPRAPFPASDPEIVIPSAAPGLSAAGDVLRADGIPVVLRAPIPATRPSEDAVLDRLISLALERRRAAGAEAV
jgi:formylmethanofuran dehydrogenase subunit B